MCKSPSRRVESLKIVFVMAEEGKTISNPSAHPALRDSCPISIRHVDGESLSSSSLLVSLSFSRRELAHAVLVEKEEKIEISMPAGHNWIGHG